MSRNSRTLLLMLPACTLLFGQDAPPQPAPSTAETPEALSASRPVPAPAVQDPQPYNRVITKDARSSAGIFTVHQIGERYYYEIPRQELGRDFLWVTRIARNTLGAGYGGEPLADRVVRWQLIGKRVYLREVRYDVVADPNMPISRAVQASNNQTILMAFPVAAFGMESDPVIEVTRLFSTDVVEFSARQRLGAGAMDASRSRIERISPYPENIEVEASVTYTRPQPPANPSLPALPALAPAGAGAMRPGSATVVLHHSMVKLPEKPMTTRLFDERVGFFNVSQMDYGIDEQRAPQRRYITRWRLEKKDPNAELSEPVKPIVFWIDSATPAKWIPYLKRGVESWRKAFEAAGFANAIVARVAPTPEEDPDFSPEDARYSMIRWWPSSTENARGTHVHDPRTGEILNAEIQFHQNVMNLQRFWYFLQAGPLDPRAEQMPLPDDLMGRLLEFTCAHEVGHTLGLEHNMKASSTYPQEKMRDRDWLKRMGFTPSIMDYVRFNYVAQPEDHIDVEDLVPRIGPYDVWAISWGYKPIAGTNTAEDEKPVLNRWAHDQDETPWYRFSTPRGAGSDPGELREAVGDADAVRSTALGLRNLRRVAERLLPATLARPGEPYDDLAELYGRLLEQWRTELDHVAAIVGGFTSQEKYVGQDGVIFVPVPRERQMEAVRFLNENAFTTPAWLLSPAILRRIEPAGAMSRIRIAQGSVLGSLLSSARFGRLVEQEAIAPGSAWAPVDFLAAVRKGVWTELNAPQVKIDAWRRNLQRTWLDLATSRLNPMRLSTFTGDEGMLYRENLRALRATVIAALPRTTDEATRAHLDGVRDQIGKILDPRFSPPRVPSLTDPFPLSGPDFFQALPGSADPCWPDNVIRP